MLETTDPFKLKRLFDLGNILYQELGDLQQDARFLKIVRRTFLPIPFLERPRPLETDIFPPLKITPHPFLAGKRIGLVTSGGSGALVTLCGVKRALEEADVKVAAISVCSGSAIWGSMIAAGFTAQQMVDLCFGWQPKDILDPDWAALAKAPFNLGRGFVGLLKGDAIDATLDAAYGGLTLARTKIPYYAIVLNIDTNRVEYFGPHNHPQVPLSRMARVAMSLPLFVQPVRFDDHLYVDGGVVNVFPVEPLLRHEQPFDHFIGVNLIMPPGFGGEDITGWIDLPHSIFRASGQLYHAQWLELARIEHDKVRDRMLLLEPLPYSEIAGTKFYEVFIDNGRWASHVLKAYHYTRDQLAAYRG
ncbi:MAG TPA: patatin-like phospholipase family protein [Polyangia bacterium]|jgi:NTE family protein